MTSRIALTPAEARAWIAIRDGRFSRDLMWDLDKPLPTAGPRCTAWEVTRLAVVEGKSLRQIEGWYRLRDGKAEEIVRSVLSAWIAREGEITDEDVEANRMIARLEKVARGEMTAEEALRLYQRIVRREAMEKVE